MDADEYGMDPYEFAQEGGFDSHAQESDEEALFWASRGVDEREYNGEDDDE